MSGDDKRRGSRPRWAASRDAGRGATAIGAAEGLLAIAALLAAHGFFVAGEFAVVAADRNEVEHRAAAGNRRAAKALQALRTLSFQLSGAQLGITITSLLVGFLIEPVIAPLLEPVVTAIPLLPDRSAGAVAVGLGLVLATSIEMVGSELIPKNLAIARPQSLTYALAAPLRAVNTLWKPLVVFLNGAANMTVRLLGIQPRDELHAVHSLEEIQILIRSSRAEGVIEEEEFSLLDRSISFGEKTAADAIVPRTSVVTVTEDTTLTELADLAVRTGHSRFPVIRNDLDDVSGVVHVKDSFNVPPDARDSTQVDAFMQAPFVVPESRSLASLLVEMRRRRNQLALVVDEYGGTAGIVTLEDVLEEIVGNIEDEHDRARAARLTVPPSGIHIVSGMLHADELAEETGFEMPEGDYDTLAGFLLTLFDRIPRQGDHTSFQGWELKVVEMDRRRIAKVLMIGPPINDEDER